MAAKTQSGLKSFAGSVVLKMAHVRFFNVLGPHSMSYSKVKMSNPNNLEKQVLYLGIQRSSPWFNQRHVNSLRDSDQALNIPSWTSTTRIIKNINIH